MFDPNTLLTRFRHYKKQLLLRSFVISDAGVDHRWITHWEKKGLLWDVYEQGKWRKFHLVEMIWLKAIIKLRGFGVPLDTIKRLRDELMVPVDLDDLIRNEEVRQEVARQHPEITPSAINTILDDAGNSPDEEAESLELLFFIILHVLLFKSHWFLLVGADQQIGYLVLEKFNEISGFEGFSNLFYRSHLSLSVNEIVAEAMGGVELSELAGAFQLITSAEAEILKQVRSGDLKSLTIHFGRDREPELLEATRVKRVELEARLMEIILSRGYQKLVLQNQNGNIIYCEDTVKTKL